MFEIFYEEKLIAFIMFSLLGFSIMSRIIVGIIFQDMIRETDNMATTRNKLLKQCKLKFANCFQLNNGVANISIFVDKFLNRLTIGPITFEGLYHLSGQTMLLSIVCAGVGICKSIVEGKMLGEILPFYVVSLFSLYMYFSISSIVDIKGKKRVLKINLVDYLENHLSAKLDVLDEDMQRLYGKSYTGRERVYGKEKKTVELMPFQRKLNLVEDAVYLEKNETSALVEGIKNQVRKVASGESEKMKEKNTMIGNNLNQMSEYIEEGFSKEQERELEDLLKEFLTSY